ncbi:MAG: response regulator, partial [Myxococcota bacterium]
MAQRILVFESDNAFADQVKDGFGGLGAEVDVVADGNAGLEKAQEQPPDLILLSIELPSMNGFLVCKKIKKNAALKSVPLIILSSDANAEEIFEQHKKLRTRAEDYVKKPIPFDDLLSRVQQFVTIEGNGAGSEPLEMSDATEVHSASSVDNEIDVFADDAFESLVLEENADEPVEVAEGGGARNPRRRPPSRPRSRPRASRWRSSSTSSRSPKKPRPSPP